MSPVIGHICVVGSINTDLVATLDRFPAAGETLYGSGFATHFGGKGANQAVAAGRLGEVEVRMMGLVGDDDFGRQYISHLGKNRVDTALVATATGTRTGIALIQVDGTGENRIVLIPGANDLLSSEKAHAAVEKLPPAGIFLLQLEVPLETVIASAKAARERGGTVILDPAPARELPDFLLSLCDFITPNETEAGILCGKQPSTAGEFREAGRKLVSRGAGCAVLKAGKNGCYLATKDMFLHVPGFPVKAVDTTAAGDTFNGAFAHALARGLELPECSRFANAAAALKTTKPGAQEGMPTKEKVEELLAGS